MIKLTSVKKKCFISIDPMQYSKGFLDIYNYNGKAPNYTDYKIMGFNLKENK